MAILIYELIIIGREQYEFQNIMWLSTSKKLGQTLTEKNNSIADEILFGYGFFPLFLKLAVTAPSQLKTSLKYCSNRRTCPLDGVWIQVKK